MFSLMANCFQWIKKKREPFKKVTLALIGLDNAGKTTTILGIQGESQEDVAPTVGFCNVQFKFEKFDVTVFDLGGGKKIRPIWKNYYAEIHGVVFVIDASDEARLRECQEVLQEVLKQERIVGKRILILANKQDKEGALDEIDICDQLNLEDMVNDSKCPCRVETCSAMQGTGKKMDKSVSVGLEWLLHGILRDWPTLSARMAREMEEQKEAEAIEKKAKLERIRKRREERERKEEEERKRLGQDAPPDEDEEDVIMGDPFKPVNKEYLDEKSEQSKKQKAKEKKKKLELEKLDQEEEITKTKDSGETEQSPDASGHSKNVDRTVEVEARLRGVSQNNGMKDSGDEETGEGRGQKVSEEGVTAASTVQEEGDVVSPQEIPEKKKKKKKKKLKKNNKLAPLPLDGPIEGMTGPLPVPSWASTMNQRPLSRPPHQPTLDPLPERISPRLSPLEMSSLNGNKLVGISSRRNQPNFEQDDDVIT
ncbi:ADP-ribosylation factor-like protein 13B isoform X2 [Patiria miniata]|uniref:ADP-ribosylation factor-like protein 13B n=1 Tax=Patiria miniata TaxID=46514 RepID=A0A914A6G0_PATMI|nr:ADP-ribosylation factor-like protein 13B isoform X1 [Patiria miniata]XP_038059335.1 ADP-ribosylation factor-like protein 13B isoform X2 [Patiria miniata]